MNEEQIKELTETTARSRSNTHRINEQDKLIKVIYKLSTSVELMAQQMQNLIGKVDKVEADVETIKSKPNKLLDKVIDKFITCIVSAVIGAIMALVLI